MKLQKHLQEEVRFSRALMNHMRKCGLYPDSNGKLLKFYMREICSFRKTTWVLRRWMTGWAAAAQRLLQNARGHRWPKFCQGTREKRSDAFKNS